MTRSTPVHQKPRLDLLPCIHPNAAGFDIGSTEIIAALPPDRTAQPVRAFGTFTPDLHTLVDWLVEHGIDTVAMESTGVYVRRITARAIPPTGRLGSEGNPRVNDLPRGESQREQQHVAKAERPRRRVWSGSARPVC
jgi:hypothetical protein